MIGKGIFIVSALFSSPSIQAASTGAGSDIRFLGYHLEAPPVPDSAESDQDFLRLHELQDRRSAQECEAAEEQVRLTLESGFGPRTGVLTREELEEPRILAAAVIAKAIIPIGFFKRRFQRPRPYRADSTLVPCISKPGSSLDAYPSGHSTIGYALALVLARKFPEKRELILRQGIKIGDHRVIGGVHHPSDVVAGRKLAEQVVRGMIRAHSIEYSFYSTSKSKY